MKPKTRIALVMTAMVVALLSYGCNSMHTTTADQAKPAAAGVAAKTSGDVYKGPVVGKSNKAKTISIKLGKGNAAKTMMVRFDDNTKGLEYAKKGEAAIITWEMRGEERFATVIKPKLAKLPAGVTEIKVEEMHELLTSNSPLTLVDARPLSRYDQAHLPGSISIPVAKLKKLQAKAIPADKDKLLIFYCGGPT